MPEARSDARSALSTPPVTSETTVFTLDVEQTVYAFDIFTVKRLWDKKLDSELPRRSNWLRGWTSRRRTSIDCKKW